jgi:fibronectin type 3 domain-containing protein
MSLAFFKLGGHYASSRIARAALAIVVLLSTGYTQVQTNGTIDLTGSVQLMAGGKHYVTLAWSASQEPNLSFRVYRSTVSGSHYQLIQSGILCLHYTDLNVSSSTTYYYVVTAYNGGANAESAYSNQITITTAS